MYGFYKKKTEEREINNELHEAILNRDVATCLQIIQSPETSVDILNQQSLNNTPAMLALKTGLIEVACALIEDERVDIECQDKRGFSLLHFACFLREDALIIALLNRHAWGEAIDEESPWPDKSFSFRKSALRNTHPFYLYKLEQVIYYFPEEIIDSDGFSTFPLILTDLLFHVDKLCLNYAIKEKEDFIEADEIPATSYRFAKYAEIGLQDFFAMRNRKPVNEEILQSLQSLQKDNQLTRRPV